MVHEMSKELSMEQVELLCRGLECLRTDLRYSQPETVIEVQNLMRDRGLVCDLSHELRGARVVLS